MADMLASMITSPPKFVRNSCDLTRSKTAGSGTKVKKQVFVKTSRNQPPLLTKLERPAFQTLSGNESQQ
jgi:hypothetical protein